MKKYKFLVAILFVCQLTGCKGKKSEDVFTAQNLLDRYYADHPEMIGLMVHVEAPDKNISWSGAVGLTNKNDTILIQPDQPANIASNTKTYVAASILKLVEQGKLSLDDPINTLISETSRKILNIDNYDLAKIKVKHLLSHTSGIFNYVNSDTYNDRILTAPKYKWTRDEQIKLAVDEGGPMGEPQEMYGYSDTNYLLLSEIIEGLTGKPFYTAIRGLLNFKKHELNSTWFIGLEDELVDVKSLIYQYAEETNTYKEDPSFDLFGGGGLASTTKDLAIFMHQLFTGEIFTKPETSKLLLTKLSLKNGEKYNYHLGLRKYEISGKVAYGHTGFYGTYACYIPEDNISISIFVSNADVKKKKFIAEFKEDLLNEINRIK
jgi:D-alanyl-D-alanine carboxypeptidase